MTKTEREANKARQAAFATRMMKAGYVSVRGIWAHADDEPKIKAYAARLTKARGDDPRRRA